MFIFLTNSQTHGKQLGRPSSKAASLMQVRVSLLTPKSVMHSVIAGTNLNPHTRHDVRGTGATFSEIQYSQIASTCVSHGLEQTVPEASIAAANSGSCSDNPSMDNSSSCPNAPQPLKDWIFKHFFC